MSDYEIRRMFKKVFKKLKKQNCQLEEIKNLMDADTLALLKRIDDATNATAARIQKLIDLANNQGSATAAEIRAALEPEVVNLEKLAADPANPTPTA